MLPARLKWAFFLVTLGLACLPIAGIIMDVMRPAPVLQEEEEGSQAEPMRESKEVVQPATEEMVLIPTGPFLRGYNHGGFDEKPEGRVVLDAYWIDRYEVTYGAYIAFVTATGHRKPISRYVKHFERLNAERQPAVYVSWEDADRYCRYRGARLPTEAEWEKAARGPDGLLWPWGHRDQQGWANTGNLDSVEFTAVVGSFPRDRSPFGVFDMAGNAMEWVSDWYQEEGYKEASLNPRGPTNGFYKVIKGASWGTMGKETRLSVRLKMVPDFRDTTIGFRCAKSAENGPAEGPVKAGNSTTNQSSR